MAEIQEYLPQVAAPEAIGAVDQNIEMAGSVGRSLERAGSEIAEANLVVQRRAAQRESAQVYAHMNDLTSQMGDQVQKSIQDGSLSDDGAQDKFLQQFDDDNEKLRDTLTTPQAQNYLTRLQSRFRGHLMRTMSSGASVLAANEAQGQWLKATDDAANGIHEDPSMFDDHIGALKEDLDQKVQSGLRAKDADKLYNQAAAKYAIEAVRGTGEIDTESARKMLNGYKDPSDPSMDIKPKFDAYLNPEQKKKLNDELDRQDRANDIEEKRSQRAIQDAQKASAEKWSADNFQKWLNNSLSTKDVAAGVKSGTLTAEQGEKWIHLINERQKDNDKPNHAMYNNLANRISDPSNPNPITKIEDVMPFVGKGITPQQFSSLTKLFNQTPEEKANAQGEKALFTAAQKTIPFKNVMTQQNDVLGEQKLAQFKADYAQAKQKIREAGGNVGDLTNPNSKDYFGNNLSKYQTSMQEQLSHQSQDRTNKALGLNADNNQTPKSVDKNVRRPNESAAEYLKRIGK